MKNMAELINQLNALDIKLRVEDDKLLFDAPKGSLVPELRDQLVEHKQQLINLLKQQKQDQTNRVPIEPVDREQDLPLSYSQEQIWLLDKVENIDSSYNMMMAVQLDGELKPVILEKCIGELIRRHEIFRTNFIDKNGVPFQEVHQALPPALTIKNFEFLPVEKRLEKALSMIKTESHLPFDLEKDPLLRILLIRLDDFHYIFLIVAHHIIMDGWSMRLFFNELSTLYRTFVDDQTPGLDALSIQYSDYAYWQRQFYKLDDFADHIQYWEKKLKDSPPLLELPIDRVRPSVQHYNGKTIHFKIPEKTTKSLSEMSGQLQATPFMTLFTAFSLLVARNCHQEDITIGTPVANRNFSSVENLMGCFVNLLALRVDLSGNPSFSDLLTTNKKNILEAYRYQDFPFEKLVDVLKPKRSLSYSPFFQVMFVLQNLQSTTFEVPEITTSHLDIENPTSKYDLTLTITEGEPYLNTSWEFNTDLFDESTIQGLSKQFQCILEHIVKDRKTGILDIPLVTETESQTLIAQFGANPTSYPKTACLQQLFEEQVEKAPGKKAVVFGDLSLTFQDLNERANQLANHLKSLGVGNETLVGICTERSLEMVTGLLAIIKAGGAYVPLDPAYPNERLSYMVNDANIRVLLVQKNLQDRLPDLDLTTVYLDRLNSTEITSQDNGNPSCEAMCNKPAYIMYTSGSTGTPKGVTVNHQAIVRLVKETNYVDFSNRHIFLQYAPVSFDAATFEIWGSILNGCQLVIAPAHTLSLKELGQVLKRHRITTLWLTAGLFNLMVDNGLSDLTHVEQLLTGGDVLSASHVKKALNALPDCTIINGYGPTENTTFTCCYPMQITDVIGNNVPIGHPIANTEVYILDDRYQLVPVGIVGEIFIGGDGLAINYLNQPDLTAQKFVPNPYNNTPGSRIYRTGDLARFRSDGTIEFIGRADDQVKIRGFRIELSEIESILLSYPGTRDAIVTVDGDSSSNKKLVAYLVKESSGDFSETDLRTHLGEWLPDYMIPSDFVFLETLPLTPNGKVDKKALPRPGTTPASDAITPSVTGKVARKLLTVVGNLLETDEVKIDDNFFEMGGNSLLIIQFISKIEEMFDISLTMADFIELPTISELAERINSLVAPQNENKLSGQSDTGSQLLQIARTLLESEDIKLSDNFFDKGGNSLQIIQFISSVEESFKISLTMADFIEMPTLSEIADKIENTLGVKKSSSVRPSIPKTDIYLDIPLSFSQRQLWYLEQLKGVNSTYHIAEIFNIHGDLDAQILRRSFNELIKRHETLRTVFPLKNGKPVQSVLSPSNISFKLIDLQYDNTDKLPTVLENYIMTEAERSYDLAVGPLIRLLVLKKAPEDFVLVLTMHHIVSDGWSMNILFRELSDLYTAFKEKRQAALEPLPIQYKDYSLWQQKMFGDDTMQTQSNYWRSQLKGAKTLLDLPLDYSRPPLQTFVGRTRFFKTDVETMDKINGLVQKEGSMLFIILLSAFGVLLSRICQNDDILIATPVANRSNRDIEPLIGYFVNILVLRIQCEGDPTFSELINTTKKTVLKAYENQEYPFEKLVEEINPVRDPAYSPLVQVMFHLENSSDSALNIPGLAIERIEPDNPTAKFDLILSMKEQSGILSGDWEYNTDLFSDKTIELLTKLWLQLLKWLADHSELPQSKLPIVFDRNDPQEHPLTNKNDQSVIPKSTKIAKNITIDPGLVKELKGILKPLLEINDLNDQDNIFEKGGNSFKVIQLIAELEKTYGVELSVVDVLENALVTELAEVVNQKLNDPYTT